MDFNLCKTSNLLLIGILIIFFIIRYNYRSNSNIENFNIVPVYYPLIYEYGTSGVKMNNLDNNDNNNNNNNDDNNNYIFSAHPIEMVCSNNYNYLTKYVKLNHSGSPMYFSYYEPSKLENYEVQCPSYIKDVSGSHINFEVDRFYFPETNHNLKCYKKRIT